MLPQIEVCVLLFPGNIFIVVPVLTSNFVSPKKEQKKKTKL